MNTASPAPSPEERSASSRKDSPVPPSRTGSPSPRATPARPARPLSAQGAAQIAPDPAALDPAQEITLPTRDQVRASLSSKLARYYGVSLAEADREQLLHGVQMTVRDILTERRAEFNKRTRAARAKKVYYLCMEFLVGSQLRNNLCNLGLRDLFADILAEAGQDLSSLEALDPDPGLGSGGLGRLAACYMDSLTTLGYPATGFSILFEYGLFKQKIVDGEQVELPDEWLPGAGAWLVARPDKSFTVRFGGQSREIWRDGRLEVSREGYQEVEAIPYDLMVSGAGSSAVNILRLWRAKDRTVFNMSLFSQGEYVRAVQETADAEILSKVLYPSDSHVEGKLLRLTQQYFLVSATLQNILAEHLAQYGTLANLAEKTAIHLNDTHPALVIPELMRLLMDEHGFGWDEAWEVVTATVSYTNHTVMPEALETWNEELFRLRLPRIYSIVKEIDRRLRDELWASGGDGGAVERMAILGGGSVRMANLCAAGSRKINGVSKLHSDILRQTVFRDYAAYCPEKFTNVTNGIAHRRWLCYANPSLTALLDECIGESYRREPERLTDFLPFLDDSAVRARLSAVKRENKCRVAKALGASGAAPIDPDSLFDVQIKRIHEYKRQLLNCLRILYLYDKLCEDPEAALREDLHGVPVTFFFAGKAAPGYHMAKEIIRLISCLSRELESNPRTSPYLRVVFLEDYSVSKAELLIPGADVSEQISLAGKEASGTSCMKLMMNGALTVGTLDGANVEIREAVGEENFYLFGLTAAEVEAVWREGYRASDIYARSDKLKRAIRRLNEGVGGRRFEELSQYLLTSGPVPDPYLCLADFSDYLSAQERLLSDYRDKDLWARKSGVNIARAGIFSSDRAIREYARDIWGVTPVSPSPEE